MDLQLLKQADFVLSKCGKPTPPPGLSVIYLVRRFLVQAVVGTNSNRTFIKEVTGDTTWVLRSIQGSSFAGIKLYVQVQLPDGRFLISALQDIQEFSGFGSWRYTVQPELEVPPGSKIQVTLDTNLPAAGVFQPEALCFCGADKYYLKGGSRPNCPEEFASRLPRYQSHPNQNILAPCWMQGYYPETPCNYVDDSFIYASKGVTMDVVAGPFAATDQTQIDSTSDFECARLLMNLTADATVTAGTFLVRARSGGGYALMDDYIDVAFYLGGAQFAKHWHIQHGDSVYFDLQLVDQTGTGNITFQAFLDGLKRSRA